MKINDLLKKYINNKPPRRRQVGRYWSSELYNIVSGKLKPEDFFKQEVMSLESCRNITEGEHRENMLKVILDGNEIPYEYQLKEELKIDDFVIVVVADFVFPNSVLECKAPKVIENFIKKYNKPQLEAQWRVFGKPVYIGYFKERWEHKFFKYEPSDTYWEEVVGRVREFHNKLKEL